MLSPNLYNPLNQGCSLSAFRANISELVGKGYSNKQAEVVALKTLRAACEKLNEPMPKLEAPSCASELDPDLDSKKADFPYQPPEF